MPNSQEGLSTQTQRSPLLSQRLEALSFLNPRDWARSLEGCPRLEHSHVSEEPPWDKGLQSLGKFIHFVTVQGGCGQGTACHTVISGGWSEDGHPGGVSRWERRPTH